MLEPLASVYSENELVDKALQTRMSMVLQEVAHRPWPLPAGPWVMAQSWHDLLFAHWPVDTGARLRGTPSLPWLSAFPELNVRTYVTNGGKPGVWFFSLDAGNSLAVAIARAWFHLPYFRARISCTEHEGWIHYGSERTHRRAATALLKVRYRPVGGVVSLQPWTLEYFLTERYCLYATDGRGHVIRGEIHHPPWPLQRAEAELKRNTMTESLGIAPASQPLLHFARRRDVVVWWPARLT